MAPRWHLAQEGISKICIVWLRHGHLLLAEGNDRPLNHAFAAVYRPRDLEGEAARMSQAGGAPGHKGAGVNNTEPQDVRVELAKRDNARAAQAV